VDGNELKEPKPNSNGRAAGSVDAVVLAQRLFEIKLNSIYENDEKEESPTAKTWVQPTHKYAY